MQFNITFFIQIINFYITYWFLNKFLFKPVINFIKKEKLKEQIVKIEIENKQKLLSNLEDKKRSELYNFQDKASKKYRVEPLIEIKIPELSQIELNKSEVDNVTKIVKNILVERVPHVD